MPDSQVTIDIAEFVHTVTVGLQYLDLSSSCSIYLSPASASDESLPIVDPPSLERLWIDRGNGLVIFVELILDSLDVWSNDDTTKKIALALETAKVVS